MARRVSALPAPTGLRVPSPPRGARRTATAAVVAGLVVIVLVAHLAGGGKVGWASNFLLVFSALILQAFPFVLVGAVVSAAIEVFVPTWVVPRIGSLRPRTQIPVAAFSGVLFPLCECGSVPVARRLAAKGLSPGAAVAFMLSAPVVNPIVLVSTAVAFRGRGVLWLMVAGRLGLGILVSMVAGWALSGTSRELLLRRARVAEPHHVAPLPPISRGAEFVRHFVDDTVFMTRFLIVGAAGAAMLQTVLPQSVLGSLATFPVLDVLAMMLLAAILSLCSESDAFVAASFVQFAPGALLAFLLVGPMFNLKLGALYAGTFSRTVVRTIAIVVLSSVFVAGLWVEVFLR